MDFLQIADPAAQLFINEFGALVPGPKQDCYHRLVEELVASGAPLDGVGWLLFGDKGLASVDRPTLIIVGMLDGVYAENALIFDRLGTPDKTFISFVGLGHMMVYRDAIVARMAHFTVAFFGYHLQGRQELASYFSEDFVAQHEDLAWGVYAGQ